MADELNTEHNADKPSNGKRNKMLVIIIASFALFALIGLCYWLYASQFEETDDATIVGHIHPVSAKITGTIKKILVEDNQFVKQGQVLAIIDPTDYKVAYDQAVHNLDSSEAQADSAKINITYAQQQASSQITQAQGAIGSTKANIAQSHDAVAEASAAYKNAQQQLQSQEANYQKALADFKRYSAVDPDAVSQQQLDTIKTNLQVAESTRNAAEANTHQAEARWLESQKMVQANLSKLTESRGVVKAAHAQNTQVAIVKQQYKNAKANTEVAKDALAQAKLNLSYTYIIAPVSGRIGNRNVEEGQRVQVGEPLMALVSPDSWVVANYKETQLQRMRIGQPVDVKVDAFGRAFVGYVDSFSPASGAQFALLPPENATGNFTKIVQRVPVKITFDPKSIKDYKQLLVPGMSVLTSVHVTAKGKSGSTP